MTTTAPQAPVYVVDASVVLKWFLIDREDDVVKALKLRDLFIAGDIGLTAPELILHEVANVIRYKPGADADLVVRAVDSLWRMDLIPRPRIEQSRLAIRLAFELGATVYDTLYLGMAELMGTKLVTGEQKFYKQAKARGSVLYLADLQLE